MVVNKARLTDAEVRASLDHMAHAITMKDQDMNAQRNQQDVHTENPPVRSMENMLRDFMRMNPTISQGLIIERTSRSLWMRCIRIWCLWGPHILRSLSWVPII